jgi:hypothetical protein
LADLRADLRELGLDLRAEGFMPWSSRGHHRPPLQKIDCSVP